MSAAADAVGGDGVLLSPQARLILAGIVGVATGFAGLFIGTLTLFVKLAAYSVRRYFGTRAFAALYGCLFMAYSLGSVVGVILRGRAYDIFGNYPAAAIARAITLAVVALPMLRLDNYRSGDAAVPAAS